MYTYKELYLIWFALVGSDLKCIGVAPRASYSRLLQDHHPADQSCCCYVIVLQGVSLFLKTKLEQAIVAEWDK